MSSPIVLSFDAAWGGSGWAISDTSGPIVFGSAVPDGDWRWDRARRLVLELRQVAQELAAEAGASELRLVVERAPLRYSWKGRAEGDRRGSDPTSVVRGLSELVGAVAVQGVWPGWAYPWDLEPEAWRSWWSLRGKREAVKAYAIRNVEILWPWTRPGLAEAGELAGDVAEAILIGAGAAKRFNEGPKGPTRKGGAVARELGRRG